MPRETPASGVFKIPASTRYRVPRRRPAPSDHGQLWDAQARESKGVAETSSPVRVSLRPHQFQLDESCGEMVRPLGQQGHPPRRLPQRSRPAGVHQGVSPSLERESPTLRVDRDRRIHSGKAHSLSADFGTDPARLHQPQVQEAEAMTAYLFRRHYTRYYRLVLVTNGKATGDTI